tara:strand:- start:1581 stop:2345 length:765 start_codon:yes stop_codon:yes gene_type:complete
MKFIILGCGSSVGVPWITGNWGNCNKNNKLNIRTRCSAYLKHGNLSILIDTSPDIKKQILDNKIDNVDHVLYTHEHADQTSGIFELRPFFWKNKKPINIHANKETLKKLRIKYDYCFYGGQGYIPILKSNLIKKKFSIKKKKNKINIKSFYVNHGQIKSTAYIISRLAYISDTNGIDIKDFSKLKNLKYLVIDCLKFNSHTSHYNFNQAISISRKIRAKKTILTNLHSDLDYELLKKSLPKNIIPAYDGMVLNL